MATAVHPTEVPDQPIWDINRDAFAPPRTRRLIRGWDRAPVQAHAPRLQGQKVWKKVGLKLKTAEDEEDETQEELQKEGAGARKKSRTIGSRENIGDAIWVDTLQDTNAIRIRKSPELYEGQENVKMILTKNGQEDDIKGVEPAPFRAGKIHPDIQFVPRKRTNTNHVITPKKHFWQTTLGQPAQPLVERVNGASSISKRPRKSMRKSFLGEFIASTTEQKEARTKARPSHKIEHTIDAQCVTSSAQDQETKETDVSGTRRSLRRSTTAGRRSVAHLELPAESGHTEAQIAEELAAEVSGVTASTDLLAPSSLQESTYEEFTNKEKEDIVILFAPVREEPIEGEGAHGLLLEMITSTSDSVAPDFGLDGSPGTSANLEDVCEHIKSTADERTMKPQSMICDKESETSSEDSTSSPDLLDVDTHTAAEIGYTSDQDAVELKEAATSSDRESTPIIDTIHSPLPSISSESAESIDAALQAQIATDSEPLIVEEGLVEQENSEDIDSAQATESDAMSSLEMAIPNPMASNYDHDDTDMLRNFLTRVKANKAAKKSPRRKRSLPHSPLRIPLGDMENNLSPSPLRPVGEVDITEPLPMKRKKRGSPLEHEVESQGGETKSCRRSNRTRLPVKEPPGVPSFIPVRRLGQDPDTTVTLKRNEEKELAALTRINTRKNKGGALTALEVLAKKAEEKEDPVLRQRLLKEVFDEKMEKGKQDKSREKKIVTWAEEIAQFRSLAKGKVESIKDDKEKIVPLQVGEEKKPGAVRVGVRSKAALGASLNGTPASKRKMRGTQ